MKKSPRRVLLFFFLLVLSAACGALVWAAMVFFELRPPTVELLLSGKYIGQQKTLHITATDKQRGLRRFSIALLQGTKRISLFDEQLGFAGLMEGGASRSKTVSLEVKPRQLGLGSGPARLEATVWDYSLSHWGRGNTATLSQDLIIDLVAPEIQVLAATRYLNQGGAGIVLYRISKPVSSQGILAGTRFFSGCPVPGRQGVYQALFGLPLDAADSGLEIQALDQAGNRAQAHFPYEIKPKKFRSDTIGLTDSFLQSLTAKAQRFSPEFFYPASQLNTFIAVNTVLRIRNEEDFSRICSKVSAKKLWQGPFIPLPRASTRAVFGDQRSYVQENNTISTSVHLGLDLASLDQAPVPAANAGTVAEIKHMGIYGLTLILDHGQGLFSTYSHLSSTAAQKGGRVAAGETIAHTGATGLALGDHLHFGIIIQGVFVNPAEWIDPNWIKQKIDLPLAEAEFK